MITIDTYDAKQNRAAQRVLDSLDKLDARVDSLFCSARRHTRRDFRGTVTICLPDPAEPIVRPDPENAFSVWGRSLSESGMSFIHVEPIEASMILVGIDLGKGGLRWFQSEIVRRRSIENEGFFEFGVAFRGRA